MSAAPRLPSLFGRFTAILKDHAHLGRTLRRLGAMCSALEAEPTAPEAPSSPDGLLDQLRAELEAHFSAEESQEYFGTVVAEAPELERQIAALKWEHLAMLRAADTLIELARDRARWHLLPEPARELIAELERHERAEAALLGRLFSG